MIVCQQTIMRPTIRITNHAIHRWQQRIEPVSEADAALGIVAAMTTAKDKHFKPWKLKKNTFYIPTTRAMLIGSNGKIVTVVERAADDKWGGENE